MTADQEHLDKVLGAALDLALQQHIVKIFDILCIAGSADGAAINRFENGLNNAVNRYWQAQTKIQELDEG